MYVLEPFDIVYHAPMFLQGVYMNFSAEFVGYVA